MTLAILFPVTAIVVAGYVVLYFSTQAQGRVQTFGKVLSYWVFFLAAVLLVGGLSAPFFGGRPFGMHMMSGDRELIGPGHMRGGGAAPMLDRAMRGESDMSGPGAPAPPAPVAPEALPEMPESPPS